MSLEKRAVVSSNLISVAYDKETQELQVEFVGGGVYSYSKVPESVFNDLVGAKSVGSFFSKNIRGSYEFKKV